MPQNDWLYVEASKNYVGVKCISIDEKKKQTKE